MLAVQRDATEYLRVDMGTDGLFLVDTDSGSTEVGADLVKYNGSAEWQTWTFLVTFGVVGNGTCDVYLEDSTHAIGSLVGDDIPCSKEGGSGWVDGTVGIIQYGVTNNNRILHTDFIKVATGLNIPAAAAGGQVIFVNEF